MNKKMIALALAAAFAAPAAFADTGTVKISGYVNLSLDRLDSDTQPADPTTQEDKSWYVSSNASNIVFSGDEPLGNGLKAIWQMQNFVNFGSSPDVADGNWTNGNSFVGLQGGWGTFLMGRNDTPMKVLGRKVDLFGNQIGDSRNLIAQGSFDARPGNIIQYNSPAWSGFQMSVQYAPDEGLKNQDDWSASLGYENGPLLFGLAYERHNRGTTITGTPPALVTLSDEDAWRLGAGYSFGNTRLVGLYEKVNDLGGVANADRNVWGLGAAHKMGANTIKLQYYKADDRDDVGDSGASLMAVGWDYAFSKRTTAYVAYAKTKNDSNAAFSAFGGGHGDTPPTGIGAGRDPSGLSLGLVHKF